MIRVTLAAKELLPEGKRLKDYRKARIEAEYPRALDRSTGLEKLCAESWREVAILCPRNAGCRRCGDAPRAENYVVQIQSERDLKGDSPAYAWLTALRTVMTEPHNAYEIVGVLREILASPITNSPSSPKREGFRFRIDEVPAAAGKISSHLQCAG